MTVDAKQVQIADGQLRLILPGTWVQIPLRDEAETTAFVKRLVKRQVGSGDRLARVRRQMLEETVTVAREAVKAGIHTYLMSLEILPGVPFPAAILMADRDWPDGALEVRREHGTEEALTKGFPGAEVASGSYGGEIARRYEMARQKAGEDGEEFLTMRLEYFVPYPYEGVDKILAIRANVPQIPQAEPFALLFNEIVDSITFPEVPPTREPVLQEAQVSAEARAAE
ncbi:hypothetical protein [Promicromonospora aerolata]|uniref:Uncharacterized protein n=1 Tax=Promicromonospora aerolata TaxID=195749 RepID=A0ABW4VAD6_9MICO